MVYIDDILIFSEDNEQHMHHLKIVAKELRSNGIILSEKKAELNRTSIDFLGVTLENGRVRLQPHVLTFLDKFPNEFKSLVGDYRTILPQPEKEESSLLSYDEEARLRHAQYQEVIFPSYFILADLTEI